MVSALPTFLFGGDEDRGAQQLLHSLQLTTKIINKNEQEPSRTPAPLDHNSHSMVHDSYWHLTDFYWLKLPVPTCSHLATCKIVEAAMWTSPILRSTSVIIPKMLLKYIQMTQHTSTFSNYNLNGIDICSIDITMRSTMTYIVVLSFQLCVRTKCQVSPESELWSVCKASTLELWNPSVPEFRAFETAMKSHRISQLTSLMRCEESKSHVADLTYLQ